MQFRASEIYNRDNTQGMANAYGRALTSGLRLEDIYAWPDIVQASQAMTSLPRQSQSLKRKIQ